MAALLVAAPVARAQQCYDTMITGIDSSGRVIRMATGQLYLVYPGDNQVSVSWEPSDKLSVCEVGGSAVVVTDLDQKGGKVRALRQFN